MVAAQYRLLTQGLQIDHLRLVLGTSMGGMHTWLWGEIYPDFMDALLPLVCLPAQICAPQPRLAPNHQRCDPQRSGRGAAETIGSSHRACVPRSRSCS